MIVKENDVYCRERETRFTLVEKITFYFPKETVYQKADYDWYMTVALEKVDKVTEDRHLLTADLIIGYRNAIREAYQHMLDPHLLGSYDHPRNRNTVKGIKSYINKMLKSEI